MSLAKLLAILSRRGPIHRDLIFKILNFLLRLQVVIGGFLFQSDYWSLLVLRFRIV